MPLQGSAKNTSGGHPAATPGDELAIHRRGGRRPVAVLATVIGLVFALGDAATAQTPAPTVFGGNVAGFTVADGKVFVGGTFLGVSAPEDTTGDIAIVDAVTGERAGSVANRMHFDRKLQSDGAGGLYLYDPFSGDRLTRIRADGTVAFSSSGNGGLLGVTMVRDGNTLYMGGGWNNLYVGSFDLFDQPFVAAFDANTLQPIRTWQPRVNGLVRALHVANGVLYMAGAFTSVANGPGQPMVSRGGLAAFDLASGAFTPWNPSPNQRVNQIQVVGSTAYILGPFTQVAGQARRYLAAVDVGTGAVLPWNPSPDSFVSEMRIVGNAVVLGGQFFRTVSGAVRVGLAAVDAVTGAALPWAPRPNDSVYALAVRGTTVYACGAFSHIDSQRRAGCAAFDFSNGGALLPWNPSMNGAVTSVDVDAGRVLMTGSFTGMRATVRKGLAALDPATGRLLDWEASPDIDGVVGLTSNGTTRLFLETLGINSERIDAIDIATGARPPTFQPRFGGCLSPAYSNGRLVCSTTGQLNLHDPDTGAVTSALTTVGGLAYTVLVSGDVVYFGGNFDSVGGAPRRNFAAVSLSTGALLPMDIAVEGGYPRTLMLNGATLFVGGDFGQVGGQRRIGIAPIDTTTGTVAPWPTDSVPAAAALAIRGNRIYAAIPVDGPVVRGVATFDLSGRRLPVAAGIDRDFGQSATSLLSTGGTVFMGGRFYRSEGEIAANVAVLRDPPVDGAPRNMVAAVSGNRVDFTWDAPVGDGAEMYILEAGVSPGTTVFTRNIAAPGFITGWVAPPRQFSVDAPNGTFYVRVRASVLGVVGAASNEVAFTTPGCGSLSAPIGLVGSATAGVVTLQWQAAPGASSYVLEAGTSPGASNIGAIPTVGAGFQSPAPPGTYYVRVRATNACGVSSPSNEVMVAVSAPTAPGAPTNLQATVNGQAVRLTWTAPSGVTPGSTYVLEAGSAPSRSDILIAPLGSTTALDAAGVPPGVYYVRVRARNAVGDGPPSNEVSLTVRP